MTVNTEIKQAKDFANSETYRGKMRIPKLPADTDELAKLPSMQMKKAKLDGDKLIFENDNDFIEVISKGFFLLKIPRAVDLTGSDHFVNNFYRDKDGSELDRYKGFKDVAVTGDYQGYFDRPNDQWENYYIEARNWAGNLPEDVSRAGKQMADIGIKVIREIFRRIGIPENEWEKVSGGLSEYKGHQMLAFNHFRPEKVMRGTKLHRDSGWVTVLRSTQPGLVAMIGDQLYAVNPLPDYFTINFGSSIEILTSKLPIPVRANIHGVVKTLRKDNVDRTSYVIFLDSDLSGNIYRAESGRMVVAQTMKDFAIQEVSRTYDSGEFL